MHEGSAAAPGFAATPLESATAKLGVDADTIAPTGFGGRLTGRDLVLAADRRRATGTSHRNRRPDATPEPWPDDTLRPFTSIRRRTASHLRDSFEVAAPALIVTQVDYSAVERARSAWADSQPHERRPTALAFVLRATVAALSAYPDVNAVIDGDALRVRRPIHLGISIDLDFEGLVVPVIHHADSLVLRSLAERVRELAARARARRLGPDDLVGGTFTVTNAGAHGNLVTAPILHHPQVGIVSTDGVAPRPVAVPDGLGGHLLAIRPVGNLSFTFDHRAFDGAYASAFLRRLRDELEQRDWTAEL
jgi:pyruvate dehydrogenase E2 component (dihydrolipoamide acetyltransferase)